MTKLRSVDACKRDPSTFEGWEEEEDPTKDSRQDQRGEAQGRGDS